MDLIGVHHVSLNVGDLEATTAFYRDVVGLEVLPRPDHEISVPGTWLGMPDGRELHLLVNDVPEAKGQHFAFQVADVDAVIATLTDAGYAARGPRVMEGICRQATCYDPSGNLVEFNQRLNPSRP